MNGSRRRLLSLPLAIGALAVGGDAPAQARRRSAADPLRVGTDTALAESGLTEALRQGFGRDTGMTVTLVVAPALATLTALEQGELDAVLSNAPQAEARLEQEGLAHDRRVVATGRFVLVGPPPPGRPTGDPRTAVQALADLRDAALAGPGAPLFVSAADGSGSHLAEQALWRRAGIAPAAPWYVAATTPPGLMAQARSRGAWALVEHGAWLRHGGAPLAVRAGGTDDGGLDEPVHVLRSFRSRHAAAAIFVGWVAGPKGRRTVAAQRAYRVV